MTQGSGAVNPDAVMAFLGRVVGDGAAAVAGLSTSIGGRLGLYTAMAGAGPMTSAQLAERTGLVERYVREWLDTQVAGEYVLFDAEANAYSLPAEHAAVLADPASPAYAGGLFALMKALYATEDALVEAFRGRQDVGWQHHSDALFEGVAAFFRPTYAASLVAEWLPSLDGVVDKLEHGASVADVGCGYGYSTLLMAEAYPKSRFYGFDFHEPSIKAARKLATEHGLADRVSFEAATVGDFPGATYDLITFFDCLHDMGNPGDVLHRAEQALAQDGTCMIVEPNTSHQPQGNINPVGRAFAGLSTALCLPSAMAQKGPEALGNHAGEEAMRDIASRAGLGSWKLATQGLVSRVYEVKR
ncbi:class I SAM-dependent methyltransferase [Streptomyces sp. NPDC046977]|uniref:class I SAM-dependent methyltransferase n=1 Tax=Streptomyces sp. NPDC046977 TaxID=3154703 RepID=UPI0033C6CDA5